MQKFKTLLMREQLSGDFEKVIDRPCSNAEAVYEVMKLLHADMQLQEHMWTVHLNTKMKITGVTEVSVGAIDRTVAMPAEVFRTAILAGSSSIVVVHNHPSGDSTPSSDDWLTTRRLVEAGRLIGIDVADHIILGDNEYTSLSNLNSVVFTD